MYPETQPLKSARPSGSDDHPECISGNRLSGFALVGYFLDVEDGAALVLAALGAGAMGQLLLVAVGALGNAGGGEEVVRATQGGAAL
jgi:hypothetical protein